VEVCVLHSHCNQNPYTQSGFLILLISISWKTHCLLGWLIIATCVPKHEKPTETLLNVLVFRHMMLCQLANSCKHSEEAGCLHLQGIHHLSWTTIMMGAANSSDTCFKVQKIWAAINIAWEPQISHCNCFVHECIITSFQDNFTTCTYPFTNSPSFSTTC